MENPRRRQFIKKSAGLLAISPFINPLSFNIRQRKINKVILRSGWSTDNIGDAASIPVICKLIVRYIPNTEVYLWAEEINENIEALLNRFFTRVNIIRGGIDDEGIPDSGELETALEEADLLLYYKGTQTSINWTGNMPDAIETRSLQYCRKKGLPYVIYGTGKIPDVALNEFREIMSDAVLGYYSLPETGDMLKNKKIKINDLDQSPEPLLAFDFKNETLVRNYLANNMIYQRKYLLVSTRFRGLSEEEKKKIFGSVKSIIQSWITDQGKKVVILPDSAGEVDPARELIDDMPETIAENIHLVEWPLAPDMASSFCEKARIILSMSHLISYFSIQSKIPLLYIPAGHHSNLYRDQLMSYGLKDYIMNLEKNTGDQVYEKMKNINDNYVAAMLDIQKVSGSTQKDIGKCLKDINKVVEKINPPEKKRKK